MVANVEMSFRATSSEPRTDPLDEIVISLHFVKQIQKTMLGS